MGMEWTPRYSLGRRSHPQTCRPRVISAIRGAAWLQLGPVAKTEGSYRGPPPVPLLRQGLVWGVNDQLPGTASRHLGDGQAWCLWAYRSADTALPRYLANIAEWGNYYWIGQALPGTAGPCHHLSLIQSSPLLQIWSTGPSQVLPGDYCQIRQLSPGTAMLQHLGRHLGATLPGDYCQNRQLSPGTAMLQHYFARYRHAAALLLLSTARPQHYSKHLLKLYQLVTSAK